MELSSRILRQSLNRSVVNGLTFVSRFLLLRTLGIAFLPEEYGIYVIIGTILAFGLQIIGLYLYAYMTRHVPGKPVLEGMAILKTILAFELPLAMLVVGLVVGTGLDYGLLLYFNMESYLWVFRLVALLLLFDVVVMEFVHYHYAVKRIEVANVMEFLASCVWIFPLVGLWMASFRITLNLLLTAWLAGMVVSFGYGIWRLERDVFRAAVVNWALLKPALTFSLPIMMANIGDRFIFIVDRWLLGFFHGPESVGRYGYAFALLNVLYMFVSTTVAGILVPYIVEADNTKRYRQRDELLAGMLKYSLLLMGYGLMVLILYGNSIVGWMTRAEYHGVGNLMVWLALVMVLITVTTPVSQLLFIQNKTMVMARISVIGVATNIFLNILLIPNYGAIGAALATSLALGMMTFLRFWAVRSQDTTNWRTSRVGEILLACAFTTTLFFILNRWVTPGSTLLWITFALGMGVVYGVVLVAFRVVGTREWDMVVKWWSGSVVPQGSSR